ncbi:Hypothetical predicted protein [Paramuricea clavata]|uniref:Uncharacterized protein n=1 Tax=Paramuricea clavata TaxID=317549 RepID=A0A7D9JLV3_PARCT|nr:Hypothetical predicted protein [Paramuricea clavata]
MPEVTPLTEAATAEERAEWEAQGEQRNQQIKEIDKGKNNVWCHIASEKMKKYTNILYVLLSRLSEAERHWSDLPVTFPNLIDPVTCNTSEGDIKGDINLWHTRLGHLNKVDVECTIGCKNNSKPVQWEKVSKPVPKEVQTKAQKALELVHSDSLGPFEVASLNGSKYAVTFIHIPKK